MKTAIAVGVISLAVLCFSPLTQAQNAPQLNFWTAWQNAQNAVQQSYQPQQYYTPYTYQNPYAYTYTYTSPYAQPAQIYTPPQATQYWNTYQNQLQPLPQQMNACSTSYWCNEPEVYAPRVRLPDGSLYTPDDY